MLAGTRKSIFRFSLASKKPEDDPDGSFTRSSGSKRSSVSDSPDRGTLDSVLQPVSDLSGSSIAAPSCQDPHCPSRPSSSPRGSFAVLNYDAEEEDAIMLEMSQLRRDSAARVDFALQVSSRCRSSGATNPLRISDALLTSSVAVSHGCAGPR